MTESVNVKEYSIGELITKISRRNKNNENIEIYTITNDKGIIKSTELNRFKKQKELNGYDIIYKGEFGYNSRSIGNGGIGLMKDEKGLIASRYQIFKLNNEIILNDYFEYLLKTNNVKTGILGGIQGGMEFFFNNWNNIKIKVPSIEKQQKIVKTLDKFTELKNELKNEIDLRKNKQMKYYLNKLLSLDGLDNNDIYI